MRPSLAMHEEMRRELEATLSAQRELGAAHEEQLLVGFLDRVEKEIDRRVDERVRGRAPRGSSITPAKLALCIPIIAIAGGLGHQAGLIVAFLSLVIVFVADATIKR